jgi:hypothetical protein
MELSQGIDAFTNKCRRCEKSLRSFEVGFCEECRLALLIKAKQEDAEEAKRQRIEEIKQAIREMVSEGFSLNPPSDSAFP